MILPLKNYSFAKRQEMAAKRGFCVFVGGSSAPIMVLAGNSGRKRWINEAEIKDTLAFWRFWGFRK